MSLASRTRLGLLALAAGLLLACTDEPSDGSPVEDLPPLSLRVEIPPGEASDSLRDLATSLDWTPPGLPLRSARVEYHAGVSHELAGVVIRGRPDRNRAATERPPAGRYHHEFHHDSDGRLAVVVGVSEDGEASVSSRMVYDPQGRPVGRITYGSFGDFVHYTDSGPTLSARITEDGSFLGEPKPLGG